MAETVPTPPPSSPTPTPTSPNGLNAKKFDGEGLPFKAKLIGMEDLSVDRDEKVCLESMFKLKAIAKARGEHKQRIQLNLTMQAVKVMDEASKTLVATHEIERISFVVLDSKDNRAFGYIYNTSDDRHQFWAIKTERAAATTVLALKELFDLAFEVLINSEKAQTEAPLLTAVTPVVPEPTVPLPAQVDPSVTLPPSTVEVKPEPLVVVKEAPSIIDWDGPEPLIISPPLTNPVTSTDLDSIWGLVDPIPPVTQPKPTPATDGLDDLFSNLNVGTTTIHSPPFNASFPFPTVQPTFPTPTPMFPTPVVAPQPPPPPATTTSVQQELLAAAPISPIAPPTVTSPFADFDFLGLSSNTGGKITGNPFLANQPVKQSIQQLQMDKRRQAWYQT